MMRGTPKQKLALKALSDKKSKYIVYGGAAGGGKSFLGCVWLLFSAISYPGTRYFIGREELKRIRGSTLVTWSEVCSMFGFSDFDVNFQDNYIKLKNGSRIDMLDLRFKPSDPMYERLGSIEYTSGWIEEAGEINFGAFDTLKTRIGRKGNRKFGIKSKLLITCNPKKNWLYNEFYKPFRSGNLPKDSVFIQAYVQDNPHLTEDYIDNLKNTKDKAKKERLLFGNWEYDDDPSQLIDYDSIKDYFKNEHVLPGVKKYITADIARKGRDKTIVRVWAGLVVVERHEMKVSKVTESADLIRTLAIKHQVPMSRTLVDEDGVGGGVVDILACNGFINNSRPLYGENYNNLKSQCSFGMAKLITEKKVREICHNESIKQAVTEEMEQVKQANIDEDGKVAIIAKDTMKEHLGRSPDEWDSIMMRYYFELVKSETVFL